MTNPFFRLTYEPAFANLGDEYSDRVQPASFPEHILRWRNDRLLPLMGLSADQVQDEHFIECFGHFADPDRSFLAMRYHGYQFGAYNPRLGDGRGFLYGQVRGRDGQLYDLGTKGSGTTPYSRGGDGRLTLKGGVREVLASEALHRLGVNTSRCLSLVETGEQLWRGDEPSPTRSAVMVRFSQSHIRFGTFERLHYYQRSDLIRKLLDHVLEIYYPHLYQADLDPIERDILWFQELVNRVAKLCGQWLWAGFCHAVLNTDNMCITGESFDYGPYAFIPTYDPKFTAAYFDYYGRYCYLNQPSACHWNLERLQEPLRLILPHDRLQEQLASFAPSLQTEYLGGMVRRLGFDRDSLPPEVTQELVKKTVDFLFASQVDYQGFFADLRRNFSPEWRDQPHLILENISIAPENQEAAMSSLQEWRQIYHQGLLKLTDSELQQIPDRLTSANPLAYLLRPSIETVWQAISEENQWQGFTQLVQNLQSS